MTEEKVKIQKISGFTENEFSENYNDFTKSLKLKGKLFAGKPSLQEQLELGYIKVLRESETTYLEGQYVKIIDYKVIELIDRYEEEEFTRLCKKYCKLEKEISDFEYSLVLKYGN